MSASPANSIGETTKVAAKIVLGLITSAVLFWAGTINIESTPPLWWDEGWALCVARTWVEVGHYGCRLNGQLAGPFQSQHFPTVVAIALGFRVLGIGIWQARVATLIVTILALWFFYRLTARLFNHRIAIATVILLIAFPPKWEIATLIVGRQVLGEMHALLYLLAGYTFFLLAIQEKPRVFLPLAAVFWGIALETKQQVLPFWAVSVTMPLVISLFRRQWRLAALIAAGIVGAFIAFLCVYEIENMVRQRLFQLALPQLITNQVKNQALVIDIDIRYGAVKFVWQFGLPIVYGLGYAGWQWAARQGRRTSETAEDTLRLMLLLLAGSWFGWFLALSAGWTRYAFPGIFLATPFLAALLHDMTGGFRPWYTLRKALSVFSPQRDRLAVVACGALALGTLMCLTTMRDLGYFRDHTSLAAVQVANYLNATVRPDEQIETVESELLFLLDRPYHYPLKFDQPYSQLTANYLVVSDYGHSFQLYNQVIANGSYRLLFTLDRYQIYERVK